MIPLAGLKKRLLAQPDRLIAFLRSYGFKNIRDRRQYISFGRDEYSSAKSIVIYKNNNDNLTVHDYARSFHGDIVRFLNEERGVDRDECIVEMHRYLQLSSFSEAEEGDYFEYQGYEDYDSDPEEINENVLNKYSEVCNERFLKDGISLESQRKFGLRYDNWSKAIIIPIRRTDGKLTGVKARFNKDIQGDELKYVYFENCIVSKTLYGYYENYQSLYKAKEIYIFEAEKSVMQADSFGVNNCVALGSSSISAYQCDLLAKLEPERVVLMTDKGLMQKAVDRDCELLRERFENVLIWDPSESVPDKSSPTDLGEEGFQRAVRKELIEWTQT